MKTRRFPIAVLALACAAAACQKSEMEQPAALSAPGKHTVRITASLAADTKTTLSQDGEGHYLGSWEKGDQIYIIEMVRGVSADGTDILEGNSSFVTTDALTAGGETATFSASFDPYYWESTMTPEELAGYTFTYTYLGATINPWYLHGDGDEAYFSLILDSDQDIYAGGYRTSNDMLVSRFTAYSSRPSAIELPFARLGTIVKITLSGFESGDVLKNGTWYTGDNYLSTVNLEDILCYYPQTGSYTYQIPMYMEGSVEDPAFHRIHFTCADDDRPIVADTDGKMDIYLRSLPGEMDDWFGMICTVDRGGTELQFSKQVNLAGMNRKLEFKDAGLTRFEVGLLPALAETIPEYLDYTTSLSANHDGFMAAWEKGAHLSGYECWYQQNGSDEKVNLTVSAIDDDYVGVTVDSGLEPNSYYIYVKGIPEDGYGPKSFDPAFMKEMVIGTPVSLEIAGNATLVTDGFYLIKNRTNWMPAYKDEFAYFQASNTYFGNYYGDSVRATDTEQAWWFQTAYSQEFPGGLDKISFTLGKWYWASSLIEAEVYGIQSDRTEVLLNGTSAETVDNQNYKYNLTGYAGVKVYCAASATLKSIYIDYYK